MVAEMIKIAGSPEDYPSLEEVIKGNTNWYSLHSEMRDLCNLARERLKSEQCARP